MSAFSAPDVIVAMIRVGQGLKSQLGEPVDETASCVLLHHIKSSGPLRSKELAELSGLDHSTVSRHVTRLLESGTVARHPDPADGRAWRLELTPSGHARLAEALGRRGDVVERAMAGWPARDRADLLRLLDRLACSLDGLDERVAS